MKVAIVTTAHILQRHHHLEEPMLILRQKIVPSPTRATN